MRLLFDGNAADTLRALLNDPTRIELANAVRPALAGLRENPGDGKFRRRCYQHPPVYGFVIRSSNDEALILWTLTDDAIAIQYIGDDLR